MFDELVNTFRARLNFRHVNQKSNKDTYHGKHAPQRPHLRSECREISERKLFAQCRFFQETLFLQVQVRVNFVQSFPSVANKGKVAVQLFVNLCRSWTARAKWRRTRLTFQPTNYAVSLATHASLIKTLVPEIPTSYFSSNGGIITWRLRSS